MSGARRASGRIAALAIAASSRPTSAAATHQGVIEHVAMKIPRRIDRGRLRINRPRRRRCRARLAGRRGQSALF